MIASQLAPHYDGTTVRRVLGLAGGPETNVPTPDMAVFARGPVPNSLGVFTDAGWHFSYFLDPANSESFVDKVKSFSHTEFAGDGSLKYIEESIDRIVREGGDLFNRTGEDELVHVKYEDIIKPGVLPDGVAVEEYPMFFKDPLKRDKVGGVGEFCHSRPLPTYPATSPAIAIGIISAIDNANRRDTIRRTWLSQPAVQQSLLHHNVRVEYAFFVGLDANGAVPAAIRHEMLLHNDIVVVNVTDTYKNMVHKVINVFDWGVKACGASYVIRSNDDVYLRLEALFESLLNQIPSKVYAGWFLNPADIVVLRSDDSGFARSSVIDYATYPSTFYPWFAQGNAYVLSSDLAVKVRQEAHTDRGRTHKGPLRTNAPTCLPAPSFVRQRLFTLRSQVAEWKDQPWKRLYADDVMVGVMCDQEGARRQLVQTDFMVDNNIHQEAITCEENSLWHFDIGVEDMERFWRNDVEGIGICTGFN